jgi:hypothetical protein
MLSEKRTGQHSTGVHAHNGAMGSRAHIRDAHSFCCVYAPSASVAQCSAHSETRCPSAEQLVLRRVSYRLRMIVAFSVSSGLRAAPPSKVSCMVPSAWRTVAPQMKYVGIVHWALCMVDHS